MSNSYPNNLIFPNLFWSFTAKNIFIVRIREQGEKGKEVGWDDGLSLPSSTVSEASNETPGLRKRD